MNALRPATIGKRLVASRVRFAAPHFSCVAPLTRLTRFLRFDIYRIAQDVAPCA